jgi:GNAT superfamily N-acetyltransferase
MVGVDGIVIRDASDADAPALAGLLAQLGYATEAQDIPARMAAMRAEPGQHVLVATQAEQVVGLATVLVRHVILNDAPFARLAALVVAEDRRGRGIGRALVAHAEDVARRAGCNIIEVTSATQRGEAHQFYRRLGYAERPTRFTKPL